MIRQGISRVFHWLNLLSDVLAVCVALVAAYVLRFSGWPVPLMHEQPLPGLYLQALPVVAGIVLISYHYAGLYLQRRGISGVDEFSRIVRATTVAFLIIVGVTFFYRRDIYSRVVFGLAWVFAVTGVFLLRTLLRRIQVALRRRGVGVARLGLVGLTEAARLVAEQVRRYPGLGYRLIGFVAEAPGGNAPDGGRLLGTLDHLPAIIREERLDEVIFALPASAHARIEEAILASEAEGADFKIVSDLFGLITNPMNVDDIYGIPVFALKEAPLSRRGPRMAKRALDLAVTVPGLLALSPLLLVLALLVKASSPGPVLYRQERMGRGNRPFPMLKFRSMRLDAEKESGPVWATRGDDRRTPVGSWLRRTSLDELPQLFNVLRGDMSLVGPRPERPYFVEQFKETVPRYLERHKVKAGITGWAQVHGLRGNTSVEERTTYDLWYVENWSLILDLKIIARTLLDVFHHKDAY